MRQIGEFCLSHVSGNEITCFTKLIPWFMF
jgi:hypothetical protein